MLRPVDAFNMIGVFTEAPNQATVTALETSRVWTVRRKVLLGLIEGHPTLARRVVEARMARLLLEQAQGQIVEGRSWATQAEMAAQLGTVADVVNRTLRKLAERQMILFDRRQIRILDPEGLRRIAQVVDR